MNATAEKIKTETADAIPKPRQEIAPQNATIVDGEFSPQILNDALRLAEYMANAGAGVPMFCLNQPGTCMGIVMRSLRWRADPFGVACKSYTVKAKDGSLRIAYEASLIHAVVQRWGDLVGDLETEYLGAGESRQIRVVGTYRINGVKVTRDYLSPTFGKIPVKNSPLWHSDVDLQFHYFGTRAWARKWRPGVILGIYTPDEYRAGMGEDDGDRPFVIEHRADPIVDEVITDPNEPPPGSPLLHRFGYALEQIPSDPNNTGALQAIYLRFQPEVESTGPEVRNSLRSLYELHLKRLRGDIGHEDAMDISQRTRKPPEESTDG